jgi:hypothetical protein
MDLASAWKTILGGRMKYEIAKEHGRRVCDVMQMLDAFAVAFNHREDDARLQQVGSPMMKVAAHLLGETLEVLNLEALTSPEMAAEMKKDLKELKEYLDGEARQRDDEFHRQDAESD